MWKKIVTRAGISVLAVAGVAAGTFFLFGGQLPSSNGAPAVGTKAPAFTLPNLKNEPVQLADLLAGAPTGGKPNGVLLVFYRGYW